MDQSSILKKDNIDRENVHTGNYNLPQDDRESSSLISMLLFCIVVDGSDSISTVEQILSDNHVSGSFKSGDDTMCLMFIRSRRITLFMLLYWMLSHEIYKVGSKSGVPHASGCK